MTKKTAVVLMNLGGPDSLEAVRPFLFNLFSDKAIIRIPFLFRWILAHYIAFKRTKEASHIYAQLGGKSPILEETQKQAHCLEAVLNESGSGYKVFIAMRYWHPFTETCIKHVADYAPDEVILLPLYPQFSTTTSLSSFDIWKQKASMYSLLSPTRQIESYPDHPLFIQAHTDLLSSAYQKACATEDKPIKILFSAHGLPQRIVDQGDPYPKQVNKTCTAIIKKLGIPSLDWEICYQSKVGRMAWLEPSIDTAIQKAAHAQNIIIVVPVSFVSEHSETLVELDIVYKERALAEGAAAYIRVPTVGTHPAFIRALKELICLAPDELNKYKV